MKCIFLFLTALLTGRAFAQQGRTPIDSLSGELPKMKEDSNKVKAFGNIGKAYMGSDPKQAIVYLDQGLQLAEKIDWKQGIANMHNILGLVIGDTGNNTLARDHFEQSYTLNKALDSKVMEINNLNNIGRSYQRESNFSKATDYLLQALAIAESIDNKEKIAMVGTNLTTAFSAQKNYAKATEYAEMTLKNGQLANAPEQIGKAWLLLGVIKMSTKDTPAAKIDMEKARKVYQEMNNKPQLAAVLSNLADLQYPQTEKQIAMMLQSQAIYDEIGPSSIGSVANIGNLGSSYYELALKSKGALKDLYLQKAQRYLTKAEALARQTSNNEYLANVLLSRADLEEAKGNYKASLQFYKSGAAINDSLFSQDKKNEIAGMEGKHALSLKDDEIALNKLRLSNERRTEIGLIAGLFLAGLIAGLVYWQSRNRKRTNTTLMVLNNQLDEANKVKAKFFGILSHDLRSPVSNLIHFLHLQKNDPEVLSMGQQAAHQQAISESAENLLTNMEAMLLWSKEQMKEFKPAIKIVAVSDLFDYLQKFFAQTGAISMQYNHAPGLTISTDENYLRIIMQNLTSNAIKALKNMPEGKIVWNARKEGVKTVLSITDNGPGIGPEQLKTLYDDHSALNSRGGFGFHLIKDLAKAIQYQIAIQSQPGKGTTFILST
jgi:signal transduction histidine kinase